MFDQFPCLRGTQTESQRQGEPLENMSCGCGHGVWQVYAPVLLLLRLLDHHLDWADCSHSRNAPSREDVTKVVKKQSAKIKRGMRRLRISAISYLNTAPLMWDFEHGDTGCEFDISYTLPSACARALQAGSADIGIIPAAAHAQIPGLAVLPG